MKKFITAIFLIFIVSVTPVVAQKASITGLITDKKTGETLPAVQIIITGTTTGTISNLDGIYSLDVEPGTYDFQYRFISYTPINITGVIVKKGEAKTINIELSESVLELNEVAVIAHKVENTEAALITMQRKSAVVSNGISSQEILKTGAGDAAGALKSVTGVSVQGGKYVYVRGLSDRYSKTILNGAEIPGLDPERNTIQMDLFPATIVDNIMIYKTFSPNLPGDFTGGLIDIKTKNFPDKFTLSFSAELGFNPQSNLNQDFLTYDGGKFDFLGFDDGTRDIPQEATGDIPDRYEDNDKLNSITKSFNKTWFPKSQTSGLNQKYSLGFGNRKDLSGEKSLGYFVGGSYSYKLDAFDDGFYGRYKLTTKDADGLNREFESQKWSVGASNSLWSVMGGLGYRINSDNNIGLTIINNHSGQKAANFSYFIDYGDNEDQRERHTLEFTNRNLLASILKGNNIFSNWENAKMNWIVSYSLATQKEPDIRYLINDINEENGETVYFVNKSMYSFPRRYYRDMKEYTGFGKVDFEMPILNTRKESKLTFGISNTYKEREYRQTQMIFAENNINRYSDMADYFDDSNIDAVNGIYVQSSEKDDQKNSYNGKSNLVTGYIMADIAVTEKFRAVFGFRLEDISMETVSLKDISENREAKGALNECNFLPSVNLTFSSNEMMNFRVAYNRTLARPSFREKTTMAMENRVGDIIVGNDSLKQTTIDNFDIRWEKYLNPGELISLGLFYKKFTDPIEQSFNTEAINPEITWRNVDQGEMYGVEAEIAKRLDFIHPLRNLKLSSNVTYVYSRVSIDSKELESKRYFDPNYSDKRVMFEQSPWIVNTILSFKTEQNDWLTNLSYTYNAHKLVIVNPTGIPDVYSKPINDLTFNIEKKTGKKTMLRFQLKNILDNRTTYFYEYNNSEYNYLDMGWGREYSLKFSYRF